jgi:hypothetical protein
VLINFVIIFKPPSPNQLNTSPGTSSSPVAFLLLICLVAFSTLLCKIYGPKNIYAHRVVLQSATRNTHLVALEVPSPRAVHEFFGS